MYPDARAFLLSFVFRTVTHVADSGTLCTLSSSGEAGPEGSPFGSHVDYVLDEQVSGSGRNKHAPFWKNSVPACMVRASMLTCLHHDNRISIL